MEKESFENWEHKKAGKIEFAGLKVWGVDALLPPTILQPRHPVEHHFPAHPMVRPVRHKVAVALELEFLVRLGDGQ